MPKEELSDNRPASNVRTDKQLAISTRAYVRWRGRAAIGCTEDQRSDRTIVVVWYVIDISRFEQLQGAQPQRASHPPRQYVCTEDRCLLVEPIPAEFVALGPK